MTNSDEHSSAATDALIQAAAAGDRQAAGEYFAENVRLLSSIARRVAGSSYDPGDLLGDAMLALLTKWADGTGPRENINAYVAQIMRNRIKDELKSPRSKVRYLDESQDLQAREDPAIRSIEISAELELVRRAMAEMPEDQRLVLSATVLEGAKPRDLEQQFARPASAIYSLSRRARANLRRIMLRLLLEDGARPECAAAAQRLPEVVADTPETTRGGRSAEHYRTCRRCRRIWARFASLATLGLAPLLIIGDLLVPTSAAHADSTETNSRPRPDATATTSRTPAGTVGRRFGLARGARVAAIAPIGGGIAILGVLAYALFTHTLWFTPEPTAELDVRAQAFSTTQTQIKIDFKVIEESWQVQSLVFTLSENVHSVYSPPGWRCETVERVVTCTTELPSPRGGLFELDHDADSGSVDYLLTVNAVAEHGARVVGTASGSALK